MNIKEKTITHASSTHTHTLTHTYSHITFTKHHQSKYHVCTNDKNDTHRIISIILISQNESVRTTLNDYPVLKKKWTNKQTKKKYYEKKPTKNLKEKQK